MYLCFDQRGDRPSLKTYENDFIHHEFLELGKKYWLYKDIVMSISLSQPCC